MTEAPQINHVSYDTAEPVLNLEHIEALKAYQDEESSNSLAGELLELFISETQDKIDRLESVCVARDEVELRNIVHFIAGSSGNLGLARLYAFCRGVEDAISAGVLQDYEACARYIPQEYELATKAFREFLDAG